MATVNDIEQLFRENFKGLLILANRMVHDEDTARDIVHDVFASLLSEPPGLITAAYLQNGIRYACLKHIRTCSARERLNKLYAFEQKETEDESWPDEEALEFINQAIEQSLTEQCRRVVRMRFTDRMRYREIAEALGVSEVAVYKHLRHAMNVLRQKFQEHER